jgi:Spherulation-specific family 4
MIVDITSSGAGTAPNRVYQATLKRARAAGITLAGYVNTDYTRRPVTAVEADVRHYQSWYGVTSIFLDEVSSGRAGLPYYRQLARYIHGANPGSKVVLNPGTYPDEQYLNVGDIVNVYENTYANYVRLDVPSWVHNFPASKFAYTVYDAGRAQLTPAIALALSRHAGYVYVTSGSGTNPYGALPSYWPAENAIIARCTVPAA